MSQPSASACESRSFTRQIKRPVLPLPLVPRSEPPARTVPLREKRLGAAQVLGLGGLAERGQVRLIGVQRVVRERQASGIRRGGQVQVAGEAGAAKGSSIPAGRFRPGGGAAVRPRRSNTAPVYRSEEHTSELQP